MQTWLSIFIGRLMCGERFEKASPGDYRLWLGVLFLTPVLIIAFTKFGRPIFEASTFLLWLGVTGFGLTTLLVVLVWARFVPALVSLGLSVISWTTMFVWFYPFAS
jgi:hypothetical protein